MRQSWQDLPTRWKGGSVVLAGMGLLLVAGVVQKLFTQPHLDTLPPPRQVITIVEAPPEQLYQRLQKMRNQKFQDPTFRCQRLALHQLGLVEEVEPTFQTRPQHPDLGQLIKQTLGLSHGRQLQIKAFYLQGTDTIFVREGASKGVIQHELAHALENQHTSRMEILKQAPSFDQRLALRVAIEGTALVAGGKAARSPTGNTLYSENLDHNETLERYLESIRYVHRRADGNARKALQLQPASMYEVLYGEPRKGDLWPETSTQPNRCSNQLGVVGLATALRQIPMLGVDRQRIMRHWVDDQLLYSPDQQQGTWKIALSDHRAVSLLRLLSTVHLEGTHANFDIQVQFHPYQSAPTRGSSAADSLMEQLPSAWQ